jgi:hypothetical protein
MAFFRDPTVVRGGKAVYGAPLGILMLEARFPRIPGDMGNAVTWPFPVLFRVVRGASPEKVVLQGARGLLPDFVEAAQDLVRLGAEAITTNCGLPERACGSGRRAGSDFIVNAGTLGSGYVASRKAGGSDHDQQCDAHTSTSRVRRCAA